MKSLGLIVIIALSVGAGFSFKTSDLQLRGSKYSAVEDASRSSAVCPLGWIYAGKLGCIYLNTDENKAGLNWMEAQFECEQLDGYLAEVTTEEEQEFLISITYLIEDWKLWWIGASDSGHESTWIWQHSDLPLAFENWAENRPNPEEHNEDDCVSMDCENKDCNWIDVDCIHNIEDNISYICQKPQEEIETTTIHNTTPRRTTEDIETTTMPNTTPRQTTEEVTTAVVPGIFIAVSESDCPCTDSDDKGCNLEECSWSMKLGELCECDQTLPDGNPNCGVDNCPGRYDIFRYSNDYSVQNNKACRPNEQAYWSDLEEAKQKCAADPSCGMFLDDCSEGKIFGQCDASASITSSNCGSTLYIKE